MLNWFYRWRLRRFILPYLNQEKFPYREAEMIHRLFQYSEPFLSNVTNYYHGHTQHIVTYYPTVTSWLNETGIVLGNINRGAVRPRTVLKSSRLTIEQFLMTEEGFPVNYESALRAVYKQLDLLYQAVSSLHRSVEEQDYLYRQLEEEFLTGLHFYLTFVRWVIQ